MGVVNCWVYSAPDFGVSLHGYGRGSHICPVTVWILFLFLILCYFLLHLVQIRTVKASILSLFRENFIFIFYLNFYWSIVALQYCVGFCCKVNQLYVYIYPLFFWISSPPRSAHIIEFTVLFSRFSLAIYFVHSISSTYMSLVLFRLLKDASETFVNAFHTSNCGSFSSVQRKETSGLSCCVKYSSPSPKRHLFYKFYWLYPRYKKQTPLVGLQLW